MFLNLGSVYFNTRNESLYYVLNHDTNINEIIFKTENIENDNDYVILDEYEFEKAVNNNELLLLK